MVNESGTSSHLPAFERTTFFEKKTRYALLIPVINEGERIQKQLVKLLPYSKEIDIFIVDGGSTDGSLSHEFLKETQVRSLLIKTGPGKLSAQLRIGLSEILKDGYEGVVLVDGNNKDGIEALPAFIMKLEEGFDHVQGSRFIRGGTHRNTPPSRYWAIKLIHSPIISIAARFKYTDTTNGFRAYSRKLLLSNDVQPLRNVFNKYELHYYLAVRAARLGFKVCEIPVSRVYPDNKVVPTKIKGFSSYVEIIKTLIKTAFGSYNP